jgi:hypothetical protein
MKSYQTLLILSLILPAVACKKGPSYNGSKSTQSKIIAGSRDENSGSSTAEPLDGFPMGVIEPTTLHRLNKYEYNNTMQDLFELPLSPADGFPNDPITHGFDNVSANLSLSPALTDLINQASETVANTAVNERPRTLITLNPVKVAGGKNGNAIGIAWSLSGELQVPFSLEYDESLKIDVLAGSKYVGAPAPKMTLKVDGKDVKGYEVKAEALSPDNFSINIDLKKGPHTLAVRFDNKVELNPFSGNGSQLVLSNFTITSRETAATGKAKSLAACNMQGDAAACKRLMVLDLAERAWRRPLTAAEKTEVSALWDGLIAAKASDIDALKTSIQAITLSSKFLFRNVEPLTPSNGTAFIDDYSLASRLSYFLWAGMPDSDLLESAAAHDLRTADGLKAEVRRMLKHPKAKRFIKSFVSQWLGGRTLELTGRDTSIYKTFTADLKTSMANEGEYLFADFLTNGKPINDLLNPGFAFLDDRLAAHYGLPLPKSATPVKVPLTSSQRGGLLTQAAWLTITSQPTDTMPVKRGAWVLENILCKDVPPPPAVPPLAPPEAGKEKIMSVRERMNAHLNSPSCKACHGFIDPIGFGLEAYDAVGAWRTLDSAGKPVDTKGTLPGALAFDDADGLMNHLRNGNDFQKCLTKKLFAYANGRSVTSNDSVYLDSIAAQLAQGKGSLDELIELIVLSPTFRMSNFSEEP